MATRGDKEKFKRFRVEPPQFVHPVDPSFLDGYLKRLSIAPIPAPEVKDGSGEILRLQHEYMRLFFTLPFIQVSIYNPKVYKNEVLDRVYTIIMYMGERLRNQARECLSKYAQSIVEVTSGGRVSEVRRDEAMFMEAVKQCKGLLSRIRMELLTASNIISEFVSATTSNLPVALQSNITKAALGFVTD